MRFELIRGGDASSARGMWYALYIPASHLPLGKKHALLIVDGLMTAKKKSQSLLKELTTSGISVSAANIVTLPLGKMQGGAYLLSHCQQSVLSALLAGSMHTILRHYIH